MAEKEAEHYAVDEAARVLGASPARVRQLLRAGELEGERRKTYVEGVLGPWRIPKRAAGALREARGPADDATVVLRPGEVLMDASPGAPRAEAVDAPSDASEQLSESVREIREGAEGLLAKLGRLESRWEAAEIQEFACGGAWRRRRSAPRLYGPSSTRNAPAGARAGVAAGDGCSGIEPRTRGVRGAAYGSRQREGAARGEQAADQAGARAPRVGRDTESGCSVPPLAEWSIGVA